MTPQRPRFLGTLFLFAISAGLGYVLKDVLQGSRPRPVPQATAGSRPAPSSPGAAQAEPEDDGLLADEPEAVQDDEDAFPAPAAEPAVELIAAAPPVSPGLVRGEEAAFFRTPSNYAGRDLEMELQMITAKKLADKWRLNLVYTGPGREIEYLYVDDAELLGETPDLRIGYSYKVRFRCGSGVTASGNTLLFIAATGRRADWATGISAVE